jgi:hypothetical protein
LIRIVQSIEVQAERLYVVLSVKPRCGLAASHRLDRGRTVMNNLGDRVDNAAPPCIRPKSAIGAGLVWRVVIISHGVGSFVLGVLGV